MNLKINKRRWLRGTGGTLRDTDGKQCCLGFLGVGCGLSTNDIKTADTLSDLCCLADGDDVLEKKVATIPPRLFKKVNQKQETLEHMLVMINDDESTSDAFKEKEITRLMKLIGVNVTFFYS